MEPYYGNYLGIVVNNQDPEERKRVQVFIPHLSNTLYNNWNSKSNSNEDPKKIDKYFRNPNELGSDVLEKLKQLLPWAEAAAPIFGGNTGMTANASTGRLRTNNNGTTLSENAKIQEGGAISGNAENSGSPNLAANKLLIFSGSNDTDVAAYKLNLEASIQAAIDSGKTVVVVQPALGGDGGSAIANAAQEIADKFKGSGVGFVSNTSYTTSDGVHPDANGYKQIGLGAGSIAFGDSVAVGYNAANGIPNNDISSTIDGLEVGRRGIGSQAILDLLLKNLPQGDVLPPVDTKISPEEEKALEESTVPLTASADGEPTSLANSRSVNVPYTVYSLPKKVGGTDERTDPYTEKGYSSAGKNLTPGIVAVNSSVYPLGTIFKDPSTGYVYIAADRHGNSNPNVIDFYLTPSQYRKINGTTSLSVIGSIPESQVPGSADGIRNLLSQYGTVPPGESAEEWFAGNRQGLVDSGITPSSGEPTEPPQDTFINSNRDARNANAAGTSNGLTSASGSPNGTLSVPNPGAKVWVFFYGGDIQKPVYFAAAIEPTT